MNFCPHISSVSLCFIVLFFHPPTDFYYTVIVFSDRRRAPNILPICLSVCLSNPLLCFVCAVSLCLCNARQQKEEKCLDFAVSCTG